MPLWLALALACGPATNDRSKSTDSGDAPTTDSPTPGTGTPAGTTPSGTTPTGITGTGTASGTGTSGTGTGTGAGPTGDTGPGPPGDTAAPHTGDTAPPPPPCLPRVIAHRGASGLAPEDTLAALELAFAGGVRMAEVDVRVSADGHAFLMHDIVVDRTTPELGSAADRTLAELQALDAGSWRGDAWDDERVPSLVDAFRLAHTHGATLYLDPKTPAAEAVAAALDEAGVGTDVVHLSFGDPFQLEEYRAVLPDVPATWWGGIPELWGEPGFDEDEWFRSLDLANVIAVEFDWPSVIHDERFADYADACRDRGLEVWTFTVNAREAMVRAVDELGLDGIETDYPLALHDLVCLGGDGGPEPVPGKLGTWSFTDGLRAEAAGSQLVAVGGLAVEVGSTDALGVPTLPDGRHAPVLAVPAATPEQALRVFPNAIHSGIGDGLAINRWTLLVDLLRPARSADGWVPLIQTNHLNENDAELYLRPGDGAIGILEQYHGAVPVDSWVRIAVTVDTSAGDEGEMRLYLDGVPVGTIPLAGGIDQRFSMNSTWAYSEALLFSDIGGFTSDVYVSSIQLHQRVLAEEEIAALSGADAGGLPPD